jgi:hypothetical protein
VVVVLVGFDRRDLDSNFELGPSKTGESDTTDLLVDILEDQWRSCWRQTGTGWLEDLIKTWRTDWRQIWTWITRTDSRQTWRTNLRQIWTWKQGQTWAWSPLFAQNQP